MSLAGKTAVITGSNSGIGLGVARELAKAGANVVLNSYTDTEEDHALAAEIAKVAEKESRPILEVAIEMTNISKEKLEKLLDPEVLASGGFTGST